MRNKLYYTHHVIFIY